MLFRSPDTPFKALLNIRNLSEVKLRVYRISHSLMLEAQYDGSYYLNSFLTDERLQKFLSQESLHTQIFPITNEGDLRDRSYELPLDGLPKGQYLLIASNGGDDVATEGRILGFTTFSCTKISYVISNANSENLMLLNRRTGKAIPHVEVESYQHSFDKENSRLIEIGRAHV